MTRLKPARISLIGCACAILAACGGGGAGGGTNFIPPPPPAPTPSPTPTPTTSALQIFPDVTETTEFAALGYEAGVEGASGETPTLAGDGFAVRYDGSTGDYILDLPSQPPAALHQNTISTPNDSWWHAEYEVGGVSYFAYILRPSNPELALTYTSLINLGLGSSAGPEGWVAFGIATPQQAVPVTGTATYAALVRGSSEDRNGYIRGAAQLVFDFGAGQLSGHFTPEYVPLGGIGDSYSLGRYDFVNTVFGVGSTIFSGEMSHSTLPIGGSFNGQFTGPAAQELLARWTATFRDPLSNQDSQMFGVWVGRR